MNIFDKLIGWVDELFAIFKGYSSNYSQLLIYALLLAVASKIFKVRVNLDTKGGK